MGGSTNAASEDGPRARAPMRQRERHDAITERVINDGTVRIEDLAEEFGVSTMTVHRDVDALAAQGILRKSRGVVSAVATSLFEASTEYRTRQYRPEKQAIAAAAFDLIAPGQAVVLDDSTTGLYLAELLPQRQPLTVITNFQHALNALTGHPGIAVIGLGGQYYQWCDAYMGSLTLDALRSLRADVLFMSTPAVTDGVCFHQHHDAALVKKAMFESAAKRVLMVDHSKFTARALHAHIPLRDFDVVITDDGTPQGTVDALRDEGATVLVAGRLAEGAGPRDGRSPAAHA